MGHITRKEGLENLALTEKMVGRSRQLKFMGHITRKEGLENLALTGENGGKKE